MSFEDISRDFLKQLICTTQHFSLEFEINNQLKSTNKVPAPKCEKGKYSDTDDILKEQTEFAKNLKNSPKKSIDNNGSCEAWIICQK